MLVDRALVVASSGGDRGASLGGGDIRVTLALPGAEQALAVEPLATRRQIEFPRGYARVNVTAATVTLTGAKGINGVQRSTTPDDGVYCFDLTFTPRTAVASAQLNNNATVGTVLGSGVPVGWQRGCVPPFGSWPKMSRLPSHVNAAEWPVLTFTPSSVCMFFV